MSTKRFSGHPLRRYLPMNTRTAQMNLVEIAEMPIMVGLNSVA